MAYTNLFGSYESKTSLIKTIENRLGLIELQ